MGCFGIFALCHLTKRMTKFRTNVPDYFNPFQFYCVLCDLNLSDYFFCIQQQRIAALRVSQNLKEFF